MPHVSILRQGKAQASRARKQPRSKTCPAKSYGPTPKRSAFSCKRSFPTLTDLHKYVTELSDFADDPAKSNESKLEAIQMAWHEEFQDAQG